MLFSKPKNINFLKECLEASISDLRSADYQFVAYDILKNINNFLFSYCFFSSFHLRMRINWVKRRFKDTSEMGPPTPILLDDVTMINMIVSEIQMFLNS